MYIYIYEYHIHRGLVLQASFLDSRPSPLHWRLYTAGGRLGVCEKAPTLDVDMFVDLFFMVPRVHEGAHRGAGIGEHA